MICEKCGARINDDSLFCRACGATQRRITQPRQTARAYATEPSAASIPNAPLNCSVCPNYQNGSCVVPDRAQYIRTIKTKALYGAVTLASNDYYKFDLADRTGQCVFPNLTIKQAKQLILTYKEEEKHKPLSVRKSSDATFGSSYLTLSKKEKKKGIIVLVVSILLIPILFGLIMIGPAILQLTNYEGKKFIKKYLGPDNIDTTFFANKESLDIHMEDLKKACENG